jgi:hypothetical protein
MEALFVEFFLFSFHLLSIVLELPWLPSDVQVLALFVYYISNIKGQDTSCT